MAGFQQPLVLKSMPEGSDLLKRTSEPLREPLPDEITWFKMKDVPDYKLCYGDYLSLLTTTRPLRLVNLGLTCNRESLFVLATNTLNDATKLADFGTLIMCGDEQYCGSKNNGIFHDILREVVTLGGLDLQGTYIDEEAEEEWEGALETVLFEPRACVRLVHTKRR